MLPLQRRIISRAFAASKIFIPSLMHRQVPALPTSPRVIQSEAGFFVSARQIATKAKEPSAKASLSPPPPDDPTDPVGLLDQVRFALTQPIATSLPSLINPDLERMLFNVPPIGTSEDIEEWKRAFNPERLAWVGDTVLNVITSTVLYATAPMDSRGSEKKWRSKLLSNAFLRQLAEKYSVHKFPNMRLTDSGLGTWFEAYLVSLWMERGSQVAFNFLVPLLVAEMPEIRYNLPSLHFRAIPGSPVKLVFDTFDTGVKQFEIGLSKLHPKNRVLRLDGKLQLDGPDLPKLQVTTKEGIPALLALAWRHSIVRFAHTRQLSSEQLVQPKMNSFFLSFRNRESATVLLQARLRGMHGGKSPLVRAHGRIGLHLEGAPPLDVAEEAGLPELVDLMHDSGLIRYDEKVKLKSTIPPGLSLKQRKQFMKVARAKLAETIRREHHERNVERKIAKREREAEEAIAKRLAKLAPPILTFTSPRAAEVLLEAKLRGLSPPVTLHRRERYLSVTIGGKLFVQRIGKGTGIAGLLEQMEGQRIIKYTMSKAQRKLEHRMIAAKQAKMEAAKKQILKAKK